MDNYKSIKKIALLHPTFGYNGGAENVILSTAKSFYNLEIETSIYTYKLRYNIPDYIRQFKTNITLNPFVFKKTARFLCNELINYDAILIHNFPATIFFGFAYDEAKKNNIELPKSFWYCHEPVIRLYGYDDESYKKLQNTFDFIARYTMYLDKLGVSKIDYIISNSVRTKEGVKRVYNRDSKVIYPSISQIDTNNIIQINDSKHFIYIGRIEKSKNLENSIYAFRNMLKKINNENLQFIIAGRGKFENYLKKLVKKIKMENNIIFKGFVSEEEKNQLLNTSYAMIMPAINEPFGLTVIEALYSSCISIISNKSGVYEVVKNCSVNCDMSNIDDIEKSILFVYNNKNIKKNILSKSKNIINNFTINTYSNNILNYIETNL